jgi:hypothetical protein
VSPLGKSTVASAHANESWLVPPGAPAPHSANCQTTPASFPTRPLSQAPKERFGNFASRLEAGIRCAADIARFSNDSDWAATLKHTHNAMRKIFIFLHAFFSI